MIKWIIRSKNIRHMAYADSMEDAVAQFDKAYGVDEPILGVIHPIHGEYLTVEGVLDENGMEEDIA